jgi:hypothetical protein
MKTLIKTIAIVSSFAALNANAAIQVSDDNQTSFDIGGSIEAECKINSTALTGAATLDLASTASQDVATVELWCNTGQSTASTTYTSTNSGVLKNGTHDGQDIAYLLDVSQTQSDMNLSSAQTVAQASNTGVDGASTSRTVSIKPQITGFEYEGSYSDTITVTVALN